MELRWLSCLMGGHRWVAGPPEQAYRHRSDCGSFETFERARRMRQKDWSFFLRFEDDATGN